jgi:argininosuccinate lyase
MSDPQTPSSLSSQPSLSPNEANSQWGGRFSQSPDEILQAINVSIETDKKLWSQDIQGSTAHITMLRDQNIVSASDADAIINGLKLIRSEIETGQFRFKREHEDIHMNIEARLRELIGPPAGRLHTARSRNDQVATDFKMWVREALAHIMSLIQDLRLGLYERTVSEIDTILPGFTHLQPAQPVSLAHHFLAYVSMLKRDYGRMEDALKRADSCPLGAGALAGTPFNIDRFATAKALGFAEPMDNSLDAVSSRDFALEALSAAAICANTCSRMAEEWVLWSSPSFGFIGFSDAFSTGSSIMPQKRNPDAAELVRAKSGRVTGSLVSLLMVMKGLPLAYSKDMQDDKAPVFEAFEALELALRALSGMVRDMKINRDKMRSACDLGYLTATDLADWLVRTLDLPFREAHHITGAAVKRAEALGVDLSQLSLEEMRLLDARITEDVYSVVSVEASVSSRTSYGGTAPSAVKEQCARLKREFS